jgi:hypothetical protein
VRPVPGGPGESGYHGVPGQWKESVNWDAYGCITGARIPWSPPNENGRVVPLWQHSGESTTGEAGDGSSIDQFPVNWFGLPYPQQSGDPFDPTYYVTNGMSVYIEFTDGPNVDHLYEATAYNTGVLELTENLVEPTNAGDPFIIYYPASPQYIEYFLSNGDIKWPLIETFCERYGEAVDAAGFVATGKKWAAEQARAQTYALPENPYTLTLGPDFKDGNDDEVSMWATYPFKPFTAQDGWLSDYEWGEVAAQAREYGVNHFDWFVPNLLVNTGTPQSPVWETTAETDTVFTALYAMTGVGDPYIYHNIACIADWDKSGTITEADATAFMNALSYEVIEADLNNDGLWDEGDEAIFNAAFCIGDCAPIDNPGCTGSGPGTCEDADWCDDGTVAVADIFCFFAAWIANDYEARNYGGTEGVPALFAWLANWFAWGIGPCDP